MSTSRVRRALETALNTWAQAQSPALQIAWENVLFDTPTVTHLRANIMPAVTRAEALDGRHRGYRGVFQIAIYVPIGGGAGEAMTMVDALDAVFSPSTPLTNGGLQVFIEGPISVAKPQQESDWLAVPLSIVYRADDYK